MDDSIIVQVVDQEDMFSEAHLEILYEFLVDRPDATRVRTSLLLEPHQVKQEFQLNSITNSVVVIDCNLETMPEKYRCNNRLTAKRVVEGLQSVVSQIVVLH